MKKDFTQPFEQSDRIQVSLFVEIISEPVSQFALAKNDDELPNSEYLPLSIAINANEELVMQITEFLYRNGLVLSSLRPLINDTLVEFTFVDNTPGRVETMVCYYARADIAEQKDDLVYVSSEEFGKLVHKSSFTDEAELAAAKLLLQIS